MLTFAVFVFFLLLFTALNTEFTVLNDCIFPRVVGTRSFKLSVASLLAWQDKAEVVQAEDNTTLLPERTFDYSKECCYL